MKKVRWRLARSLSSPLPPLSSLPRKTRTEEKKRNYLNPNPLTFNVRLQRVPRVFTPLVAIPIWAPPLYAQRIAGWGRAGLFTPLDVAVGRQMIWPPLDSRVGVYSLYLRVFSSRFLSLPSRLPPLPDSRTDRGSIRAPGWFKRRQIEQGRGFCT
ncbi:hypothetical protein FCM35_KLT05465 [Carex littledalei]|uniref:Uncharacterized protein n=1 Tax=Carex littledalei TaxID=544730 RepID=A0A833VPA2_9POAL|nr:hypothetical protein FCM35_KLT05465 [Carex littledalei]